MNVTIYILIFLFIQNNFSLVKGTNKKCKNKSNNVQYTANDKQVSISSPSTSQQTSGFATWMIGLINKARDIPIIGNLLPKILMRVNTGPEEGCKGIFGNGWLESPTEIQDFFKKNKFFPCLRFNDDAGNCLFYSISLFLRNAFKDGVSDIPNPEYEAPEHLKKRIKKIMKDGCREISIKCLRDLAAIDFIGFDYEDQNVLNEIDLSSFVDKLEVYKEAYVGIAKDRVNVATILKQIKKNPRSKRGYTQLFNELTIVRNPFHWGNESDIASLERIFNFKTIIFNNQGSAFTVPSDVDNPYNIFVLFFANAHYSPMSFYQTYHSNNKEFNRKVYYFTSEDLPEFLKSFLEGREYSYV